MLVDLAKLEFEAKQYDQVIARMTGLIGEDLSKAVASSRVCSTVFAMQRIFVSAVQKKSGSLRWWLSTFRRV